MAMRYARNIEPRLETNSAIINGAIQKLGQTRHGNIQRFSGGGKRTFLALMMKDWTQFSTHLKRWLHRDLKSAAAREGISQSEFVRRAICDRINTQKPKDPQEV